MTVAVPIREPFGDCRCLYQVDLTFLANLNLMNFINLAPVLMAIKMLTFPSNI